MRKVRQVDNDQRFLSQKLVDAALRGDESMVDDLLSNEAVDVNHKGTVDLNTTQIEVIQHEESPDELRTDRITFKTDVTPLFAAAHAGHLDIVRKLLLTGADVNQKLFKGYPTTAAAREGHIAALNALLKAGAHQSACEEAFSEACLLGQVKVVEVLINWETPRSEVLANALIHASSRGLLDIVKLLIKACARVLLILNIYNLLLESVELLSKACTNYGFDVSSLYTVYQLCMISSSTLVYFLQFGARTNSTHRIQLCSLRPALCTTVSCTPLIAAIVCRQAAIVKCLLEAGARTDCQVRLGAWSWDSTSEEVLRVGAGMAEPYDAVWCAIEYWESKGEILSMLLRHVSPDSELFGRSLLCHAVLCDNNAAAQILLRSRANVDFCVHTDDGAEFRPLHVAAKRGALHILRTLIMHGCDLNARTGTGDTALMLCAVYGHKECFYDLLIAGADLGAVNKLGQNVIDVAEVSSHSHLVNETICDAILSGQKLCSSDLQVFSPIHFVAQHGKAEVMVKLLEQKDLDVNQQNKFGFTAAMLAALEGKIEIFKVLVFAGAHIGLKNVKGETALTSVDGASHKEQIERVVFDAILANVLAGADFKPIHFAAKRGNCEVLAHLLEQGCSVNSLDKEGHTPLLLCARGGHANACKLLLSRGADCYFVNSRGETALSLAKRDSAAKVVEVIMDYIAKKIVFTGGQLSKHTRQGRGTPHMKFVKFLTSGVLSWGSSKRRNLVCREAIVGSSTKFQANRKNYDIGKGIFRVLGSDGREVHFDVACSSTAELWVRGINSTIKDVLDV